MRIVYMGTPEIAAVILRDLLKGDDEVIAVVTQPDKPKGRGKEMGCSEVKLEALANNLPIYQPVRVKEEEFLAEMERLNPDLIVVAAFGQILPKRLLDLPKYGCINVHASLLPKYRGAAPIQWAIIDGEKVTGVTIMYMAEGLDTGDMIIKELVEITPEETGGSLHDKLAIAGGIALRNAIAQIKGGTLTRTPQDEATATYVGMLKKEMGRINFEKTAVELERLIRGLNPWPSAFTYVQGKMLKIWKSTVAEDDEEIKKAIKDNHYLPGMIVKKNSDYFYVLTGEGVLQVEEVQLEGKRRMTSAEFMRGFSVSEGELLGSF